MRGPKLARLKLELFGQNVTGPRVLCLGEILFDCLANYTESTSLERAEHWTPYPGGAPANVACGLSTLGTTSAFIGCVGDDEAGSALREVLDAHQVNTAGLQVHPEAPTRQVFVLRSRTGEREFAGFGDRPTTAFADAYLDANALPVTLFERADYLVMGTLGLAYPATRAALMKSLELARAFDVRIAIDINWRPVFWPHPESAAAIVRDVLKQADYLKFSDDEARWLFATDNPAGIAPYLPQARGLLVTAGEGGCSYAFGPHTGSVPAFSVNAVDTTGAGDSFLAAFLHVLERQNESEIVASPERLQQAVRFACAAGALTVNRPGAIAAQPKVADINALLARVS